MSANSEAEAIAKLLGGEFEPVEGGLEFIEVAEDFGLPTGSARRSCRGTDEVGSIGGRSDPVDPWHCQDRKLTPKKLQGRHFLGRLKSTCPTGKPELEGPIDQQTNIFPAISGHFRDAVRLIFDAVTNLKHSDLVFPPCFSA